MKEHLEEKSFLRHKDEALSQFCFPAADWTEHADFLKTVKRILFINVPSIVNITFIHSLNKIKLKNYSLYEMKARIAPHGNKN